MNISVRIRLLIVLLASPIFTFAQSFEGGLFEPGTTFEMTTLNAEPLFWVNDENEANAYFETKDGITLLTMQASKKPDVGRLTKITRVSYSSVGFMLHGEGVNYFFGLGNKESGQYLQLLKYSFLDEAKTYDGYGIAKHHWPKGDAPSVDKLKAAKTIYDILGK